MVSSYNDAKIAPQCCACPHHASVGAQSLECGTTPAQVTRLRVMVQELNIEQTCLRLRCLPVRLKMCFAMSSLRPGWTMSSAVLQMEQWYETHRMPCHPRSRRSCGALPHISAMSLDTRMVISNGHAQQRTAGWVHDEGLVECLLDVRRPHLIPAILCHVMT